MGEIPPCTSWPSSVVSKAVHPVECRELGLAIAFLAFLGAFLSSCDDEDLFLFVDHFLSSVWFFSGAKYHGAMINGNEKSGLRLSRTRNFDLYPDIIYAPYLNLQFLHQRQTAVIQSVYTLALDEMFLS